MTIPLVIGVNPLQTTWLERGIVSGRVALLLRSAEIHPLFERFVDWRKPVSPLITNPISLSLSLSTPTPNSLSSLSCREFATGGMAVRLELVEQQ